MGVSGVVWAITTVLIAGLMLFGHAVQVRNTHVPTLREAGIWSTTYIGIVMIFGIAVAVVGSPHMAVEYFAGYLSNEALSVDNLFVFQVIISSSGVPRVAQQKVLPFGIAFALILADWPAPVVLPDRHSARPAGVSELRPGRDTGLLGIKLILEALHDNDLHFIQPRQAGPVVELSITVSLLVIVAVLAKGIW